MEGSHYSFCSNVNPNPSYDNLEDDNSFNGESGIHWISQGDQAQEVQFQDPFVSDAAKGLTEAKAPAASGNNSVPGGYHGRSKFP
jgi:hypothetical protein